MKQTLTTGIICKNAAETIEACLNSLDWVDRIIILDDGSDDDTLERIKNLELRIKVDIIQPALQGKRTQDSKANFADKRNRILKEVKTDWLFYVDADEVVPEESSAEIQQILNYPGVPTAVQNDITAYTIPRRNFFLGKEMYQDRVHRLFKMAAFNEWSGEVHETPNYSGKTGQLKQALLHYTHRDISSMLEKTNQWSEIEADLRIKAQHPPMAGWRYVRIASSTLWQQLITKRLWRYGREGWFEAYFQMIDKLIVYTKLWEKQQSKNS